MSDTDPYAAPNIEYADKAVEAANAEVVTESPKVDEVVLPSAPTVDAVRVPEGSIKEVLRWVGADPAKARAAVEEEKKGDNRSTLISKLEAIIN